MDILWMVLKVALIIDAVALTGLILVQGNNLASFGGTRAENTIGVENPLRRWTGILAALFFVLVVVLALAGKGL